MSENADDLTPYPMWRVHWHYIPAGEEGRRFKSYDSFPTASAALELANAYISEPDMYAEVQITWPHYIDREAAEPLPDGWVAVKDLTPDQLRALHSIVGPPDSGMPPSQPTGDGRLK